MNFRPYAIEGLDSINKIQAGWTDAVHPSPHSLVGASAPQWGQVIIPPTPGSLRLFWCSSILTLIALGPSCHVPQLPAPPCLVCPGSPSAWISCHRLPCYSASLHGMAKALWAKTSAKPTAISLQHQDSILTSSTPQPFSETAGNAHRPLLFSASQPWAVW